MNKRLFHILSAGLLALCVCAANAQESGGASGRYYIAPMASIASSQRDDTHDVVGGASLAVGALLIPHLGVEIVGDYLRYNHLEHTYGAGIGANLYLSPDHEGVFIHGDVEGGNRSAYNAGLGYDQPIFNRAVSLRVEALWRKEGDADADAMLHLGLRVPFGGAHGIASMAAEPVSVVPVEQSDSPSESAMAPQEEEGSAEAATAPTEEAPSTEAVEAAPAPVEPQSAPKPTSKKKSSRQHQEKAAASTESDAVAVPAIAATESEPPSDPAPIENTAPAPAASPQDQALAPTEPAPAPKGATGVVDAAPQKAPSAADAQDPPASDDDGLAPTEPAPKPR